MKILNPFSLHGHVSFDFSGSIDTGIYLLSKFVAKPAWEMKFDDTLTGKINTEKIEIWLRRPFSRNFLIPVFKGMFFNDKGKTILTGDFRLPKNTIIAFGFALAGTIALWTYIAIRDHHQLIAKSQVINPLWFCLANILVLVVALYLCRIVCIKDMNTIEQQIRKILTEGSI